MVREDNLSLIKRGNPWWLISVDLFCHLLLPVVSLCLTQRETSRFFLLCALLFQSQGQEDNTFIPVSAIIWQPTVNAESVHVYLMRQKAVNRPKACRNISQHSLGSTVCCSQVAQMSNLINTDFPRLMCAVTCAWPLFSQKSAPGSGGFFLSFFFLLTKTLNYAVFQMGEKTPAAEMPTQHL